MSLCLSRLIKFNGSFVAFSNAFNLRSLKLVHSLKRKRVCNWSSVTSPLYFKTQQRNYSLKLYSQYVGEEKTWSHNILEYIKSENNVFRDDCFVNTESEIKNVFDCESAIKQLQSIILHSQESHPEEVIKLFSLYQSYARSKLDQTYRRKESSKLMHLKIQTAILSMSFDQLCHFSTVLKNVLGYNIEFFSQLATFLFEECFTRVENCQSLSEIIQYFLIGFHLFENSVSRQHVFFDFVSLFHKYIDEASASQLSQIIYFCGLSKKNSLSEISALASSNLVSKFNEISFIESGIALNGLFRLNFKLDSDAGLLIKEKILQKIDMENGSISLDNVSAFAFVSLIKYLRLIGYGDEELMNAMKSFIKHLDKNICNPQFVSHVISLFANSNYYDPDVYSNLSDSFFKHLRSSDEVVRIKDISRVIWALSHAQHTCKPEDLELIVDTIYEFSMSGDFITHASHAVDSTLYLATLDVYSEKLLKQVLQPQIEEKFKEKSRVRYLSRMAVLKEVQKTFFPSLDVTLSAVSQENFVPRNLMKEFQYRPAMECMHRAANWLRDECRTRVFEFKFLVPHIHHCSMVFTNSCVRGEPFNATDTGKHVLNNLLPYKDVKIAVDVDDSNTALNNGERTSGLEALKRKLLRMNGWTVKVLSSKEIESCGNDDQAVAALILKAIKE
ncbi:hypothetical protein Avbf_14194 [Armadillidium vulgare]|nr:hypothetical protein Avbf_14194 [Armadillidium vulgare]